MGFVLGLAGYPFFTLVGGAVILPVTYLVVDSLLRPHLAPDVEFEWTTWRDELDRKPRDDLA